jgi:hypothetical protein
MSVSVANNFEEITTKSKLICDKIENELFDNDKYAETIAYVTKCKKELESTILVNKELFRQYIHSTMNICHCFEEEIKIILLKRDEKDNMNGGRNINASKVITDVDCYCSLIIGQDDSYSKFVPGFIKVECNKIEEMGSIDSLLHKHLPILWHDVQYISQYISLILDEFLNATPTCLERLDNIINKITSPAAITSLSSNDPDNDNRLNVIAESRMLCNGICDYSKLFKYLITKSVDLLDVIKTNHGIQEEALKQYVVTESLL